ncbi:hypothetical protein FACS1894155_09410 [Bacteroidia bacterium]|nr:hypothetical protein FACS1894155_09410 [Bacteroidia bacterium]
MPLFAQNTSGQSYGTGNSNGFQICDPHVYALARYGEIPVDYSTGVPAINIPLMTISDRDITVDLSLSYHATGIKVDQEATWVGLGWVLNAGGIITRQVRGEQDKYNSGQFITRPVIPDYNYQQPVLTYINNVQPDLNGIFDRNYDGEPDIFYYNFCGKTGKFILDANANACFFKYEDFKVEFNGNFIITDNLGVRYEFSITDIIQEGNQTEENTWKLMKITSPSGGEINFSYESGYSDYTRRRAHSVCYIETQQNYSTHGIDNYMYHAGVLDGAYCNYFLLSRITTKSGNYIEFKLSDTPRMDAENTTGKALEEIILHDNGNNIQKKINLGYGYFEAKAPRRYKTQQNTSPANYNYLNYRLRLESVQEMSVSGEPGGSYHFEYYGDDNSETDDPYTLPYRLSPCQDHWGYYNHSYNQTIFPNNPHSRQIIADKWLDWYFYGRSQSLAPFVGSGVYGYLTHNVVTGGANRDPDDEAVKAGTLKKIIYPTGGYTQFEFEPHKADPNDLPYTGGIRIKQIESYSGNENTVIKQYTYEPASVPSLENNYNYTRGMISPYHTLYYNPYDEVDVQSVPQILMAVGVPQQMALKENVHVIRINAASPSKLGMGLEALYSKVTETISGGGYTEYHYDCVDNVSDYPSSSIIVNGENINDAFTFAWIQAVNYPYIPANCYQGTFDSYSFPFPEPISNDWYNRLLTCKKVYREDDTLIAEDSLVYSIAASHVIPGYKVRRFSEYEYLYARYYTIGGSVKLTREVNLQYIPGQGNIRKIQEYDYTSPLHKQITESRTWNSSGELYTMQYYYPTEYGNTLSSLKDANILKPVDIRRYNGNKLVAGTQIQYNNAGLEEIKYRLDENVDNIPFDDQNPYSFSPYLWNTYYPTGLLQAQKTHSELSTVYLWGYNRQYPIAKIENVTYNNVKNIVGQTLIDRVAGAVTPSAADLNALNNLRSNASLSNSMVTTYTYKPLVGVLSVTDPRGVKTTYEYDDFGRLKTIKDHNGYIVETYEYNYQNQ